MRFYNRLHLYVSVFSKGKPLKIFFFKFFFERNPSIVKEQKIKILNAADICAIMQQILLRENKISRHQPSRRSGAFLSGS